MKPQKPLFDSLISEFKNGVAKEHSIFQLRWNQEIV
jgi:hypothetical protein